MQPGALLPERMNIVLALLKKRSLTEREVAEATGLPRHAVSAAIAKLHALREIRVCDWQRHDSGSLARVFAAGGKSADAPKPPSRYERLKSAKLAADRRAAAAEKRRRAKAALLGPLGVSL